MLNYQRPSQSMLSIYAFVTTPRTHLQCCDEVRNVPTKTLAITSAPQIGGYDVRSTRLESDLDRLHHLTGSFGEAEVFQHHLTSPDHANGVGNALADQVWR